MTLGARIKEERQRLGLNQTEFAALAGASRRAMVNWEADGAAPLTTALIAWANAGVDALYILTGKRTRDGSPDEDYLEAEIDEIERNLLEPWANRRPKENLDDTEKRVAKDAEDSLRNIIEHDGPAGLRHDLLERAKALFDIAKDTSRLPQLRAADFAQRRIERENATELLTMWLEDWPYQPNENVMKLLASVALDYRVPYKTLVEIAHEIFTDLSTRSDPLNPARNDPRHAD